MRDKYRRSEKQSNTPRYLGLALHCVCLQYRAQKFTDLWKAETHMPGSFHTCGRRRYLSASSTRRHTCTHPSIKGPNQVLESQQYFLSLSGMARAGRKSYGEDHGRPIISRRWLLWRPHTVITKCSSPRLQATRTYNYHQVCPSSRSFCYEKLD